MTFAEQLHQHLTAPQGPQVYSGVLSRSFPIRQLLAGKTGKRITLDEGVELRIPDDCTWNTADQADGGVKFTFTGGLPIVYVTFGPMTTPADLTGLVLRLGAAGAEIQALPKVGPVPFPAFTVTVPFN